MIKVKIKTWDKMEEEFGLYSKHIIDCNYYFMSSLEELLPEDRIIKVTTLSSHLSNNALYEWECDCYDSWLISPDMIEEVIEDA